MSETLPHVMMNAVTGEQLVIQLKPKYAWSAAEAQAFLEGRLKEAESIDPQTCEIGRWYVCAVDLYNIFEVPEEFDVYGKERFVRNVPDGSWWVWDGHLPEHIYKAVVERIELEADTYENYLERPKESRELWEAGHELRRVLSKYSFFLRSDVDRARHAHELRVYLREWHERHSAQLHPWIVDRTMVSLLYLADTMLDIIQPDNKTVEHT
jgi:hypothetical protein